MPRNWLFNLADFVLINKRGGAGGGGNAFWSCNSFSLKLLYGISLLVVGDNIKNIKTRNFDCQWHEVQENNYIISSSPPPPSNATVSVNISTFWRRPLQNEDDWLKGSYKGIWGCTRRRDKGSKGEVGCYRKGRRGVTAVKGGGCKGRRGLTAVKGGGCKGRGVTAVKGGGCKGRWGGGLVKEEMYF